MFFASCICLKALRFQHKDATVIQRFIYFMEELFNAIVAMMKVDPFAYAQAK